MKDLRLAEDHQRVVHELVRELEGIDIATDETGHLTLGEFAALVSGSLLPAELGRVEDHLMICETCRKRAKTLHADHEARVVPTLVRRAPSAVNLRTRGSEFLRRRVLSWTLGLLVFAAALGAGISFQDWFGDHTVPITEPLLVTDVIGRPEIVDLDNDPRVGLWPGQWLLRGDSLLIGPGEIVECIDGNGAMVEIGRDGPGRADETDPLLARVVRRAFKERTRVLTDSTAPIEGEADSPVEILFPRGLIHDLRPTLRWEAASGRWAIEVAMVLPRREDVLVVSDASVEGVFPWPGSRRSLSPGKTYEVKVRRLSGGRDDRGEVRFTVMERPEIDRVLRDLRGLDRKLGRQRSVVRALYFRQEGLLAAACVELEELRGQESSDVPVLRLLKATARDLGARTLERRVLQAIESRLQ